MQMGTLMRAKPQGRGRSGWSETKAYRQTATGLRRMTERL